VTGSLAHAYAVSGRRQDSERLLHDMLAASRKRADWSYMIATVYAGLGDVDRAFEWIDRAIAVRDDQLVLLNTDTHLDSLRGDARFRDVLRRVGIP
jgi:Tfp pilus assembly protein PilF